MKKIFVVEDDESICEELVQILEMRAMRLRVLRALTIQRTIY